MMSRMTEAPAPWTIDRLARLAAAALAAGAPTQPNGRIREVPDVRTIRWYTSIGLLDRPAAMRGRTALYGRSHLAQLVAIKRLQASGLTVAAVQERLLGADASVVEEIAKLPADLDTLIAPADADTADTAPSPARSRFWVTPPAAEPFTAITADTDTIEPDTTTPLITGIRLTTDITLLLPTGRTPDAAARAAIAEAAQPLLDLLNRLGLSEA